MMIEAIVVALLTGVIGPIATEYVKNKKNKKKDPVKESLNNDLLINSKLNSIKDEYDFDRVYVTQFHNGGHFNITHKSIQKFSVIYEVVSPIAQGVQSNLQNIPIGLYSELLNEVYNEGCLYIDYGNNELVQKLEVRNLKGINDAKRAYLFAIKSVDGRYIGFIGAEFVEESKRLNEHDKTQIALDISFISSVLTNRHM